MRRPVRGMIATTLSVVVVTFAATTHSTGPDGQPPLTITILVDVTASLHPCPGTVAGIRPIPPVTGAGKLPLAQPTWPIPRAVTGFALNGLLAEDEVRIGAVGRRLILKGPFRGDSRELKNDWRGLFELPPMEWLGPSPLWDALAQSVAVLAGQTGRRAIVLISDGQASGNVLGHREVAERAARAGVSLSFVFEEPVLPPTRTAMSTAGVDPGHWFRAAADLTGGIVVIDPATPDQTKPCVVYDPSRFLRIVLERLRGA
jgi:hypothetical protein